MWRGGRGAMESSGLKPLTSPAILVSKLVVSKCVIWPMPDTPSTMFDQTVSTSFPIGVMKPIPVTTTRRPLELFVTSPSLRTPGPIHTGDWGENRAYCLDTVSNLKPRSACEDRARAASEGGSPAHPGRRREAPAAFPGA